MLVIDTDPGLDDALALTYAFDHLDVDLITTVAGNTTLKNTTNNAAHIRNAHDANTPIRKGARAPLQAQQVTTSFHGETGLGTTTAEQTTAKPFYTDLLEDNTTVLCIGPLTNIAHIIQDTTSKHTFYILGGTRTTGNIHGEEFNIYADPHAAKTVFESNHDITVLPLDTAAQHGVSLDEAKTKRFNNTVTDRVWTDHCKASEQAGSTTVNPYDLLLTYLFDHPDAYKTEKQTIAVDTEPPRRGHTDFKDGESVEVITSIADNTTQRALNSLT